MILFCFWNYICLVTDIGLSTRKCGYGFGYVSKKAILYMHQLNFSNLMILTSKILP